MCEYEGLQVYSVHISEGVKEYDDNMHDAGTAAFNLFWCMHDLHHFEKDATLRLVQEEKSKTVIVELIQISLSKLFGLKREDILAVKRLKIQSQPKSWLLPMSIYIYIERPMECH